MRQLAETAFDNAGAPNGSKLRDILRDIEGQSRRMSDMLTALLEYSSLGRKYEAIETVDTATLIAAVSDSLPESGHVIEISGSWPRLATLRAPLDLVLRNLLANALQHHDRENGHVLAQCDDQQMALVIQISDDGPGIDPHHHTSIFLPFRTVKTDNGHNSTGMGLAAVKRTVEAAGGSIAVTSDPARTRGTTFTVSWPKAIRD